jgi:hypothetical protein
MSVIALRLFVATSLLGLAFAAPAAGPQIKKCQDAQGRWHYGDAAAESCATKVTVINDRGMRTREIAAPLTDAELNARAKADANAESQRETKEAQERRDRQLLATYATEEDIRIGRDRRTNDLDTHIRAAEETLKTLRATLDRMQGQADQAQNIAKTEAQIARHEAALVERSKEREAIQTQFEADVARYRELRNPNRASNAGAGGQ